MIRDDGYSVNVTLALMVRSLHQKIQRQDQEAIEGITQNLGYLLRQTTRWDTHYNAFQISTAVQGARKELPGVGRDTHRPHHYLRDIEQIATDGVALLDFVIPLPLEFGDDGLPYALSVKTYRTAEGRVSGITLNVGDTLPHNIFLYGEEITALSFGHAVPAEYPPLLTTKR